MDRINLFPGSTRVENDRMTIGGCDLAALANEFGTPLYLYDQATLDASIAAYKKSLAEHYPGESGLTYAGKAFLCFAMAQWAHRQSLWLDCTGQGELAIAAAAGVDRQQILVHGVNKIPADLRAACLHAATIVADHLSELEALRSIQAPPSLPQVWLRFQPGVEVATHAHIQTGQSGSKFGMGPGETRAAASYCRGAGLALKGLHFHLGSQIRNVRPYSQAIERTLDLAAEIGFGSPWTLSPGGGWGVAYNEAEQPSPDVQEYVRAMAGAVMAGCRRWGLPLPRLQLEPGRSLVARAGVVVYRVGTVKRLTGKTWVLLDGGLADNPRHALYGVNYSALVVSRPLAEFSGQVCLAGPYCESGDVLSVDLPLPEVNPGDLLAVPMSGAYQLSMSSNYNGALRPAVVWLKDGEALLVQERERPEDLFRRDHPLYQE